MYHLWSWKCPSLFWITSYAQSTFAHLFCGNEFKFSRNMSVQLYSLQMVITKFPFTDSLPTWRIFSHRFQAKKQLSKTTLHLPQQLLHFNKPDNSSQYSNCADFSKTHFFQCLLECNSWPILIFKKVLKVEKLSQWKSAWPQLKTYHNACRVQFLIFVTETKSLKKTIFNCFGDLLRVWIWTFQFRAY